MLKYSMNNVLIVGATSAIAECTARAFAERGAGLFLVARNAAKLEALAADLRVRGARQVETAVLDAVDRDRHAELVDAVERRLGGLDGALIAHGVLPDQTACEQDAALALSAFEINAMSVVALCTILAGRLRPGGCLVVICSVAGDRGRASNYVYGAAKAAVTVFCSGLMQRLRPRDVRVLTIKPGFVDTPMTAQFKKGALWASAADVGQRIHRAMLRENGTVYVPFFWRYIMAVIRALPESLFVRLSL